jgi:hypothetical protein
MTQLLLLLLLLLRHRPSAARARPGFSFRSLTNSGTLDAHRCWMPDWTGASCCTLRAKFEALDARCPTSHLAIMLLLLLLLLLLCLAIYSSWPLLFAPAFGNPPSCTTFPAGATVIML